MRISDWSSDVCSSDLARAEIEIDEFAGALAQAVADIVARNDEILAPIIPAAHDDMGMGMAGVEMIDRDPVELRPKILFHPRHQPAGQWLQILIVRAVLGADDEAELMAVVLALFDPAGAVNLIIFAPLKIAAPAIARRPGT